MMSPTSRTLKELRDRGWLAQVVEHWVEIPQPGGKAPHKIRRDLFGFGDIVACGEGRIWIIQVTSTANLSVRVRKIQGDETITAAVGTWLECGGGILFHGWRRYSDKAKFRDADFNYPSNGWREWRFTELEVTKEILA